MTVTSVCILILSFLYGVDAFGSGSPSYTCYTQYPMHHRTPSSSLPNPYKMTFSTSSYTPGEEVKVTVELADSSAEHIRGIQTSVRRATGNTDEIVGSFSGFDVDKLRVFNCFNGSKNMLTHRHGHKVKKYSFSWIAPSSNVGDVIFRSTFLKSYRVFWCDVLYRLNVSSTTLVVGPMYPPISLNENPWKTDVNLTSCGDSKGCFLIPRDCTGSDCTFAATFLRGQNNTYTFELYTTSDVDYVSLGFSHDSWMGHDWTVSCTYNNGTFSVQEGWNPHKYNHNDRHLDLFASNKEIVYKDGTLQCRFTLPESFDIYSMNQGLDTHISHIPWNLSLDYRLMVAWGKTIAGSSVILYHHDLPAVTSHGVDLKSHKIYRSAKMNVLIKAHAAVMIVAWIVLSGMVSVISRHYKNWLPSTKLCGTKIWFQIHRELAILVAILTMVGLVLIFSHFGIGIRGYAVPHAYVGLAVTGCVGLQVIGGMLRPNGDSRFRPAFNWAHFILGHASHILAAATMFLAFDINYISSEAKHYGIIALSLWVVVQVLWHLIFEALSRKQRLSKQFDHIALDEDGDSTNSTNNDTAIVQHKLDSSCSYGVVFLIYTICLAAVASAVVLIFFDY